MDHTPYKELLLKMKIEAQTTTDELSKAMLTEQAADEIDVATQDSQSALSRQLQVNCNYLNLS